MRERVALALLLSSPAWADVPRGTYSLTKPEEPTALEYRGRPLPPCEREIMDRVGERRHVIVEFTPDVQPGATIQVNGEDWVFDSEAGYTPGGCTRCAAFAHLPKPPLGVRLEVWWGIRDKKAGGALVVTGLDTKGDPRCANVRPFNGTFKRP